MKKLFIYILFSGLFVSAQAQLTITSSFSYVSGDVSRVQIADETGVTEGAAGAGVNADFSGLEAVGSLTTSNYVLPSATPYSGSFPGATVAMGQTSMQDNQGYVYYKSNSSQLELMGVATATTILSYSNTQKVFEYPFTYSSSFTDDFYTSYTTSGTTLVRRGTTTTTGDAYGSVTTPALTADYIRVKIEQSITDSLFVFGDIFIGSQVSTITTYNYMNPAYKDPLVSISYTITMGSQSDAMKSVYYHVPLNSALSDLSAHVVNAAVYPNPAISNAMVQFNLENEADVHVRIIDITGKEVEHTFAGSFAAGQHEIPLNMGQLSKGVYFVRLMTNEGMEQRMKFIVE